jgi:citrate lyase subunit beta/citryl-CoA lyase
MSREGRLATWLFAPATSPRHCHRALAGGCDVAIIDLEDGVSRERKEEARRSARELLQGHVGRGRLAFVRINSPARGEGRADLEAVVLPQLAGVMVPKVGSPAQIEVLDWALGRLERQRGVPEGQVAVLPLLETAAGLAAAGEIARSSPRVCALALGVADLAADLGARIGRDSPLLAAARAELVVACRSAGVGPPLDPVHLDLQDLAGLEAEAVRARQLGFQGKACIHPRQAEVVARVFAPTPEEREWAQRVLSAFAAAEQQGRSSLVVDGEFVDYAVAARARRLLGFSDRVQPASRSQ